MAVYTVHFIPSRGRVYIHGMGRLSVSGAIVALQLRNWALHPDDAVLPLEEIAYRGG
jgi:hypothetical protein